MADVGKNIRLLRTQRKMTQDELAEKLFVSRQTVSNYETGRSQPDIDTLLRIAEALDVEADISVLETMMASDGLLERQDGLRAGGGRG